LANQAVTSGLATQQQANEHIERVAQRYNVASQSTQKFTEHTGLARHELINLGRQAQDVGVSLASGQSPLMVLVQQGSQIADVFISSGKSVGSFFSQAIGWAGRFFTSTAGIVTGIGAIGIAAVYAASQFVRASTTIEEALENQNRLLKEGKALIDARTSAEARAQLQSKEQTQFETMRNLLDLQNKLNKAMEDAAKLAASRATTPTGGGMPEMGIAPSGFAPLKDPGLDKITDAFVRLNAARDAGLPGLKEFNAELSKIGLAHPELAQIVEDMIQAGRAGMDLEVATMRAKAMSDALAGVATNAQLAAVGLGSIAQFQVNNLQAEQAKDATERQAVAVLQMAEAYPGMSIEVAKQLDALKGQQAVAEAVTGSQKIEAETLTSINTLLLQGKTLTEATAIAEGQRAVALANVNAAAERTLITLKQQLELANATTASDKSRVAAQQQYKNLVDSGVKSSTASDIANTQRQIEQRAQWAKNAEDAMAEDRRRRQANEQARQTEKQRYYDAAVALDKQMAGEQAAAHAAEGRNRANQAAADAAEREGYAMHYIAEEAINAERAVMAFVPHLAAALGGVDSLFKSRQGGYSQFNPQGYVSEHPAAAAERAMLTQIYGQGGFDQTTGEPNAQGYEYIFNRSLKGGDMGSAVGGLLSQGVLTPGQMGAAPQVDTTRLGILQRAIELLPTEQQVGANQQLVGQLEAAPRSLQTSELIKQLNEKIEQLTQATDANTDATSAMTDVLSPFYSSDPRKTHLGFRAFATGGIMTQYGELPLKQYQGGGVASSPQVAVYGEGSTPEAYVPVPSGRIPVEIKTPANSNTRPVHVTINVQGNADAGTVAALKSTAFQQAQAMRRVMR